MRRAQRVLLDLGVEPGDDLACRDHIAHIDGPLDHPPVEAKGEADLVLGADLAGQRNGLAFRDALDGDRPDGPGLGGGWRRLVAARDGRDEQGGAQNLRLEHWRCLSSEGEASSVSGSARVGRRLPRIDAGQSLQLPTLYCT